MIGKKKGLVAMDLWALIGGFLAVAVVLTAAALILRKKVTRFSQRIFGTANLFQILSQAEDLTDQSPRSLNSCDGLLLPQILRDFPDFDENLAKTYVRSYLNKQLGGHEGFTVHNIAMARYLSSGAQKTIIYQAAVSWLVSGKCRQKRYDLHYTYLLPGSSAAVAANCPNCGAALGYGARECSYCGSRVAGVLGNTWKFTELKES